MQSKFLLSLHPRFFSLFVCEMLIIQLRLYIYMYIFCVVCVYMRHTSCYLGCSHSGKKNIELMNSGVRFYVHRIFCDLYSLIIV